MDCRLSQPDKSQRRKRPDQENQCKWLLSVPGKKYVSFNGFTLTVNVLLKFMGHTSWCYKVFHGFRINLGILRRLNIFKFEPNFVLRLNFVFMGQFF